MLVYWDSFCRNLDKRLVEPSIKSHVSLITINMQTQFKSLVGEIRVDYLARNKPKVKICKVKDAYDQLRPLFTRICYKEEVFMLMLNRSNFVLGWAKVSEGGVSATLMDVKIIYQHALMAHASAIILAHNHPSGNLNPSQHDLSSTNKIKQAGKYLDIDLFDHLIITKNDYYSFSDHVLL